MLPYENLSLQNLKGERWKDVAGYEGYYKVSNLGRVKSLDREVPHPRLKKQTVKGRMLRQKIVKDFNKQMGDAMVSLQVAFTVEGITRYFNVRRIVFAAFKSAIDFQNDNLYVINKDGDGYNNRVSNLKLATRKEKQRRTIDRGRLNFEFLKTIDRSDWKKNYSRRKPVNQYTLEGKLIRKYASIMEAARITGHDAKGISTAARGSYKNVWAGFKWRFGTIATTRLRPKK